MVLQKTESLVKAMLSDTIMALCRNTLPYEGEVSVEGLIGVTLDNKEIFLVSINETIQKEGYSQKRSLTDMSEVENDNSSGSSQESDSDSQDPTSPSKRKRKRRRRSKDKCKEKSKPPDEGSDGASHRADGMTEDHDSENNADNKATDTTNRSHNLDNDGDSRLSAASVKQEQSDDDDLVFVKEEPSEVISGHYHGQSFPGANPMFDASQTLTHADPLALGQLQELAFQLSSDQPSATVSASQSFNRQ